MLSFRGPSCGLGSPGLLLLHRSICEMGGSQGLPSPGVAQGVTELACERG